MYSLIFVLDGENIRAINSERLPNMSKKTTKKAGNSERFDENPEWTPAKFARAVPLSGLPENLQRVLKGIQGKRGPQQAPKKVPVSIRLSPDVVETLRASGAGWQTRVDEILRKHL
jgi:uncharacterized protein (DUF4415 family)